MMEFTPVWDAPIALYLFLAGLGGGAFITSAFAQWLYPESTTVRKIGRYVAPIVVAVGLVLLMFDAKGGFLNPMRFALLLTNFSSIMTWGVVFLAIFEVIALIVAIMELRNANVPRWLNWAGCLFGFAVAAYTGVLLGVVHTYPLWNNPLLPVLFVVSAVSTGAASVMLGSLIVCRDEFERMWNVKKVHFFLPITELVLIAALLFVVASDGDAANASVMSLVMGDYAPAFWLGLIIIGLIVPTCIEAYPIYITKKIETSTASKYLSIFGECGVLVGGFLLRYLIIVAALPLVIVS